MEKINGICIDGKFYELVETPGSFGCDGCELQNQCRCRLGVELCRRGMGVFRFSPELTERLNNPDTNTGKK